MASSNQTTRYKLCQWLENDPVLREDFNADNRKIENALFQMAGKIDFNEVVIGQYTGTGLANTQAINLGFTPKLVLVMSNGSEDGRYAYPLLCITGCNTKTMNITGNGFQVKYYQNISPTEVGSQYREYNPYRYFAVR